ncbi:YciI family protein [Actinoplanes sp. NPDC049802]|uniref:YciI family protein n=1 Tax=Actinoplanes sp. NPDC049802 TaxID=3154742 RepID=UPI0033D6CF25
MKYLLLAYTPVATWDAENSGIDSEEAMAAFAVYQRFQEELTATGEFVGSEGLGHPAVSTTLRRTPDGVVATDGPFAELKEVLASYAVIDCASQERAVEIAGRIVAILGEPIEIRPIMCADLTG